MPSNRQVSARQVNCNFVPQARVQFHGCLKKSKDKSKLSFCSYWASSGSRASQARLWLQSSALPIANLSTQNSSWQNSNNYLICSSLSGSLQQKPAKSQLGDVWMPVIDILFHVNGNITSWSALGFLRGFEKHLLYNYDWTHSKIQG